MKGLNNPHSRCPNALRYYVKRIIAWCERDRVIVAEILTVAQTGQDEVNDDPVVPPRCGVNLEL